MAILNLDPHFLDAQAALLNSHATDPQPYLNMLDAWTQLDHGTGQRSWRHAPDEPMAVAAPVALGFVITALGHGLMTVANWRAAYNAEPPQTLLVGATLRDHLNVVADVPAAADAEFGYHLPAASDPLAFTYHQTGPMARLMTRAVLVVAARLSHDRVRAGLWGLS